MQPVRHPITTENGAVLYFAYGANLARNTLSKRGGTSPVGTPPAQPARVVDPCLGIAFAHRGGYATLVSHPPQLPLWQRLPEVTERASSGSNASLDAGGSFLYWQPHGALYELTQAQFDAIMAHEIGYSLCSIEVVPYGGQNQDAVRATAFMSQRLLLLRRPVAPSQRYRDRIVQGAQEQGLCEEYVGWLQSLPGVEASVLGRPEYSDTLVEAGAKGAAGLVVAASAIAAALQP